MTEIDALGIADPGVTTLYRNLIIGQGRCGAWSSYRLQACTASDTATAGGLAVTLGVLSDRVGADFLVLRVQRPWSILDYAMGVEAVADTRRVHRTVLSRYLHQQRPALEGLGAHIVEMLLFVRLPDPPPGSSSRAMLKWCVAAEADALRTVRDAAGVMRARCRELVALVRHALRRGIPVADDGTEAATALLGLHGDWPPEVTGPIALGAIEHLGGPIVSTHSSVRVDTELGASHQAFLRVDGFSRGGDGRRPDVRDLLSALDRVEFPVDAALRVRRDLGGPAVTPSLSLCVSASSPGLLERRVVALRRQLAGTRLARPVGDQLQLFHSHLPGFDPSGPPASSLTTEQLGALPVAEHSIGSEIGVYVGHTLSGPPRPVLFDPAGGSDCGSPGAVLLTGATGTGKTTCLQLILYHAFMVGSLVFDFSPGGDHGLERLPGVAEHVDVFDLSQTRRFAGFLDPLRIGPLGQHRRLAFDFLVGVLPTPVPTEWETQIGAAIELVTSRGARGCAAVATELEHRGAAGRAAARAIREAVGSGPAALGFAMPGRRPPEAGRKPITTMRLGDGERSRIVTPGSLDVLLLRLLATYALHLGTAARARHCTVGFDDAEALFGDEAGRDLVTRLSERSRTRSFTPLIATRQVRGAARLADSFGTAFCFRSPVPNPAATLANVLTAPGGRPDLRIGLPPLGPGCCLMRDEYRRVGAVQIDIADDRLLPLLDGPDVRPRS